MAAEQREGDSPASSGWPGFLARARVRSCLGHGSNASVLCCQWAHDDKEASDAVDDPAFAAVPRERKVAVKVMSHFWDSHAKELLDCERRSLELLPPHRNIVKTYAQFQSPIPSQFVEHTMADMQTAIAADPAHTTQIFLFEYAPITLDTYRYCWPWPLPWPIMWSIARDLVAATVHLDAHNIAHLDVKLDNILVDYEGRAILTDFGISRDFPDGGMSLRYREPFDLLMNRLVLAPEVLARHDAAKARAKAVRRTARKGGRAALSAELPSGAAGSDSAAASGVAVAAAVPALTRGSESGRRPPIPSNGGWRGGEAAASGPPAPPSASLLAPNSQSGAASTGGLPPISSPSPAGSAPGASPSASAAAADTIHFARQGIWSVGVALYEVCAGYSPEPGYPADGGGVLGLNYSLAGLPPLRMRAERVPPIVGVPQHTAGSGAGASPLEGGEVPEPAGYVRCADGSFRLIDPALGYPPAFCALIMAMLHPDPHQRITAAESLCVLDALEPAYVYRSAAAVAASGDSAAAAASAAPSFPVRLPSGPIAEVSPEDGVIYPGEQGPYLAESDPGDDGTYLPVLLRTQDPEAHGCRLLRCHPSLTVGQIVECWALGALVQVVEAALPPAPVLQPYNGGGSAGPAHRDPSLGGVLSHGGVVVAGASPGEGEGGAALSSGGKGFEGRRGALDVLLVDGPPATEGGSSGGPSAATAATAAGASHGNNSAPSSTFTSSSSTTTLSDYPTTRDGRPASHGFGGSGGGGERRRASPLPTDAAAADGSLACGDGTLPQSASTTDETAAAAVAAVLSASASEEELAATSAAAAADAEASSDGAPTLRVPEGGEPEQGGTPSLEHTLGGGPSVEALQACRVLLGGCALNREATLEAVTRYLTPWPPVSGSPTESPSPISAANPLRTAIVLDLLPQDPDLALGNARAALGQIASICSAAAAESAAGAGVEPRGEPAIPVGGVAAPLANAAIVPVGRIQLLPLAPASSSPTSTSSRDGCSPAPGGAGSFPQDQPLPRLLARLASYLPEGQLRPVARSFVRAGGELGAGGAGAPDAPDPITTTATTDPLSPVPTPTVIPALPALPAPSGRAVCSSGDSSDSAEFLSARAPPSTPGTVSDEAPGGTVLHITGGGVLSRGSSLPASSLQHMQSPLLLDSAPASAEPAAASGAAAPVVQASGIRGSAGGNGTDALVPGTWTFSASSSSNSNLGAVNPAPQGAVPPAAAAAAPQQQAPVAARHPAPLSTHNRSWGGSGTGESGSPPHLPAPLAPFPTLLPPLPPSFTVDMREAVLHRCLLSLTALANVGLREPAPAIFPFLDCAQAAVMAAAMYPESHEVASAAVGLFRNLTCTEDAVVARSLVEAGVVGVALDVFFGRWRRSNAFSAAGATAAAAGGGDAQGMVFTTSRLVQRGVSELGAAPPAATLGSSPTGNDGSATLSTRALQSTPLGATERGQAGGGGGAGTRPPLPNGPTAPPHSLASSSPPLSRKSSAALRPPAPVPPPLLCHGADARVAEDVLLAASNLLRFDELQTAASAPVRRCADAAVWTLLRHVRGVRIGVTEELARLQRDVELSLGSCSGGAAGGAEAAAGASAPEEKMPAVVDPAIRLLRYACGVVGEPASLALAQAGTMHALVGVISAYPAEKGVCEMALHVICSLLVHEACRTATLCPYLPAAEAVVAVMAREDNADNVSIQGLGATVLRNLACVAPPLQHVRQQAALLAIATASESAEGADVLLPLAEPAAFSASSSSASSAGGSSGVSARLFPLGGSSDAGASADPVPLAPELSPALAVTHAGAAAVLEAAMERHPSVAAIQENGRCALYNLLLIGAADAKVVVEQARVLTAANSSLQQAIISLEKRLAATAATAAALQSTVSVATVAATLPPMPQDEVSRCVASAAGGASATTSSSAAASGELTERTRFAPSKIGDASSFAGGRGAGRGTAPLPPASPASQAVPMTAAAAARLQPMGQGSSSGITLGSESAAELWGSESSSEPSPLQQQQQQQRASASSAGAISVRDDSVAAVAVAADRENVTGSPVAVGAKPQPLVGRQEGAAPSPPDGPSVEDDEGLHAQHPLLAEELHLSLSLGSAPAEALKQPLAPVPGPSTSEHAVVAIPLPLRGLVAPPPSPSANDTTAAQRSGAAGPLLPVSSPLSSSAEGQQQLGESQRLWRRRVLAAVAALAVLLFAAIAAAIAGFVTR